MMTLLAFVVALGLLIAIHEYGHYRVAVACGVKVLRFSIGFGKPLLRWRLKGKPTEFVISLLPLGGYVKMLDERDAPVDPAERHLAFNNRPLAARAAVVAAGPLANLLLAVALYAFVNWVGQEQAQAIVSTPVADSVAQRAGLLSGEQVVQAGPAGQDAESLQSVRSFDDLRWHLTRAALEKEQLRLLVRTSADQGEVREVLLDFTGFEQDEVDASLMRAIGLTTPYSEPVIQGLQTGGAADQAGLQVGDRVLSVDGRRVPDAQALREWIRQSAAAQPQRWELERSGQRLILEVRPQVREEDGGQAVRIGAFLGSQPAMVLVREEPWNAFTAGVSRTWDMSLFTLRMLGRMLVGDASLKNLSGPLTMADYAGKTAEQGWVPYLLFLAVISVSLGVLNLLPLPMLDGGHLMYYLWEALTGRSVSEVWMDRLQRGGIAVLMVMMAIALFNDVNRLLG